jgi:hydroxymethylpyrimidine/phosphomethylpyrimidine kinase
VLNEPFGAEFDPFGSLTSEIHSFFEFSKKVHFLPETPLKPSMSTVLTIAGYDPSSGAGVTADLMVFAAHGLFGTSCITALTVQSTQGVFNTSPVAPATVSATLDCLDSDLPPDGIKIGMLATAANVAAVSDFLERLRAASLRVPIVLDPVLRSSSGRELLDPEGLTQLCGRLLPLVDWITPNLEELDILSGQPVSNRVDLLDAALKLQSMGRGLNVLATAGHLDPPDDYLLTATSKSHWLQGVRVETTSTHGTGCALSSALLSRLVMGDEPAAAARAAKKYVARALSTARPIGKGRGPLNLLWPLHPAGS